MTQRQITRTAGQLLALWLQGNHNHVMKELTSIGQNRSAHLMMVIAVAMCSVMGDYDRGRFLVRLTDGYPDE